MSKGNIALGTAGLAALGLSWALHYHGAAHVIGIDTQLSEEYAFFSGFGTWLLAALGFTGTFGAVIRTVNCHTHGCPWIGRFPVAGGQFRVCRKHHIEVTGHPHKLTTEVLQALHREHLTRQHGSG